MLKTPKEKVILTDTNMAWEDIFQCMYSQCQMVTVVLIRSTVITYGEIV